MPPHRPHPRGRIAAAVAAGLGVALLAPSAAPAAVFVQDTDRAASAQPTTRPGQGGPDRDGPRRGGGDRQDGPRDERRRLPQPTQEEWDRTVAFLREHAPRRLQLYEMGVESFLEGPDAPTIPPTADQAKYGRLHSVDLELPRPVRGARGYIFARVRMLMEAQERDPRSYESALKQYQLEDQIIGHLHDARRFEAGGDAEAAEAAREQATEAIRVYAEHHLEERERRLVWMRGELAREEEKLSQDRQEFDNLVERMGKRFEQMLPGGRRDDDDQNKDRGGDPERKSGDANEQGGKGQGGGSTGKTGGGSGEAARPGTPGGP